MPWLCNLTDGDQWHHLPLHMQILSEDLAQILLTPRRILRPAGLRMTSFRKP